MIKLKLSIKNKGFNQSTIDDIMEKISTGFLEGTSHAIKDVHSLMRDNPPRIHKDTGNLRNSYYVITKPYKSLVTDIENASPEFENNERRGTLAAELAMDHQEVVHSVASDLNLNTKWISMAFGFSAYYAAQANSYEGENVTLPGSGPGWWDKGVDYLNQKVTDYIHTSIRRALK